jgi:hypothetical protein
MTMEVHVRAIMMAIAPLLRPSSSFRAEVCICALLS